MSFTRNIQVTLSNSARVQRKFYKPHGLELADLESWYYEICKTIPTPHAS